MMGAIVIFDTQANRECPLSGSANRRPFFRFLSVLTSSFGALLADGVSEVYAQSAEERPWMVPYVSAFLTRSQPTGGSYYYKEDKIPSLTIDGGTGGGLKVGGYMRPMNYGLGFELEAFGHGGKLSAPQTRNGGVVRFANQDFTMVNVMGNVLLRYRGDLIQPYVGGGVGLTITRMNGQVQSQGGLQTGSHGIWGFGAQVIAGARLVVTQHLFLFAEYKYLVSYADNDSCTEEDTKNGPCLVPNELNYQSHYGTVGIGFSF
jgi:opacity protein-like surface antigen